MKKRLISLLLALALFVTLLPAVTLWSAADTVVGYHSTDGQTWTSYTSTTSLINTIQKQSGTHYVKMETDWNLKSTISDRITINSSANVTIYMQGHVIDRGLTSQASYGNVFLVEAGAALVLDGGTAAEQETRHLDGGNQPTIKGYNVITASPGTLTTLTGANEVKGAVLTGAYTKQDGGLFGAGASYYGGAIQMLGADTSVTLINVTVVGNRTNFGGGAINVDNTRNTVTLENSRLIYNYAGEHGGGIRMNSSSVDNILNAYTCTLKMTNSAISHNYSGRNGGGIESDAVLTLRGDGNSYISDNVCAGYNNGSNYGGGGGIDVYKGAASISGVIIDNNKTNSYQGGGVLIEGSADSEIKNCTITNNTATGSYGKGGGVFLKFGGSTLSDCTITGNSATSGSGVYLDSTDTDAAVNLGGMLHITGNTTSNLYLSAGTYLNPNQNGSSVIGITAAGLNGDRQLSKDAGTYATAPYVYDGGGYGFMWCNDPTDARYRYLYIVSSGADAMPADQPIALDSAAEVSGGYDGGAYKLIKAAYSTSSAADSLNESDAVCFYSDGYFFDDPAAYNEHLASMSMALVTSGFTTNWGGLHTQYYTGTAPDAPLSAVRYNNKHAHIRQLLANLGFADADFYASEMELSEPMMDTVGVAISHKALQTADGTDTGKILVPVVVRSNGYEDEWASNFTLGAGGELAGGESLGFAMAANMVYSELMDYIADYGLTAAAQQGRLIFWVVGYSRGGATANLTARRLLDGSSPAIDVSTVLSDTNATLSEYVAGSSMAGRAFALGENRVISYTFEAPQGGTDAAQAFLATAPEKYFTLHNVVSAIDPVPYVAMTAFGFKRYGVDHYVPGLSTLTTTAEESAYTFTYAGQTHTVAEKTITAGGRTVTTYRDNDFLAVPVDLTSGSAENTAYLTRRAELLRQYQLLNPYMIYDDYFEFAEINYSSAVFGSGFNPTVTCSMSREEYTAYLIQKIVDWKASSRTVYTSPFVLNSKTHSSYQGAIRDVFKTIYGLTPQQTEAFSDALRTTMSGAGLFGSNVGLFGSAINLTDIGTIINTLENYGSLNEADKEQNLEDLWSKLVKLGLLDALPADAAARLKEDWYTLGDLLLTLLYQDRNDSDVAAKMGDNRRVLGTALYNYSRMFLNHYSETVMAWLRTYDGYYANETVHYVVTRPTSVAQPAGEAVNANGYAAPVTADAAATEVAGTGATLYLDVADLGGEAIYYTVGGASGEQTYNGREGIALSGSIGETVTVSAYAMSYGVKSPAGAYRITFTTCRHESTALTGYAAATCTEAGYSGDCICNICGETVTAGAAVPALGHDFTYTDDGNGATHTVTCSRCDYSATETHAYAGGICVCGAAEVVETLQLVSAAPVLNDKIDMIYAAEVPESYSDPYVVFTFNGATATVTEYTTDGNGRLCFVFADINPQCIGDDITATLYATKNGATESDSVANYSVRDYCVNKLTDDTISASLRTLLSDLLAYGAAAQTYMNYKTNDLVTSGTINDPTYSTFRALSGNAARFDGTAASDLCWTSASLTLTSSVAMNFRFYAESTANLSVTVSVNGRPQTFTSFTAIGGGIYEVSFTGIEANEFAENVTASFARNGSPVGNTLTYSVNAYVQSKQSDSSAALRALVQALYNYGAAAAAYTPASEA